MKVSLLFLLSFIYLNLSSQTIRYVKPVSSGTGDGSSWANASGNLQGMINAGTVNDEVWVAAGIYKPAADINGNANPGDPRTKTFVLKQGVKVYGGFNGTEATLSQRDFIANITILSGDIGAAGTPTDNSYHVITCYHIAFVAPTRLDGVQIMGGNANINGTDINGIFKSRAGGLYINGGSALALAEMAVDNCTFTNNFAFAEGGAVYLAYSISSFNNCTFSQNSSNIWGGAVAGFESDLPFTGCHFISNSSSGAGAIYNFEGKSIIQSCDFSFNHAVNGGAIIHSTGYPSTATTSIIKNSVFVSNSANVVGGALVVGNHDMQVINCGFVSNTAANEGGAVHISTNVINVNVSFYNCSFTRNTCTANAGKGAALFYYTKTGGEVRNSILWNNTTPANTLDDNNEEIMRADNTLALNVSNSIVRDYDPVNSVNINWGAGISTADPLFLDATDPDGADNKIRTPDDGLTLQGGSLGINTGNNAAIPPGTTTDIIGLARIAGPAVDLGAYEKPVFCIPPAFTTCSPNITTNTAPGQCSAVVTYATTVSGSPFPNVSHTLSGATISGGLGTGSGKVFNKGITTVTIRAANSCYTATCVFTVTVLDNEPPTITCPANIAVTTDPNSCTARVDFSVSATDNCSAITSITSVPASGSSFPLGVTTVNTTATDARGNTSSCSFTVTVTDNRLPVISTQPADVTICEGGNATFNVTATNAQSYQWQLKKGNNWVDILGETGSSLLLTGVSKSMDNTEYRAVVKGTCSEVISGTARLFVKPQPDLTIAATGYWTLWPNQSIDINAALNPSGGNLTWYLNGSVLPGVTGLSIKNITVEKTGVYKAAYTGTNGCTKVSSEISVTALPAARVWVYPNPNNGTFQVRYFNQANEKLMLKIFNDAGQLVYSKAVSTSYPYTRIDVDLDDRLSHGIYTLKLFREDETVAGTVQVLIGHK